MRAAGALFVSFLICTAAGAAEYAGGTPPPETVAITGSIHDPDSVTREEIMKLPPVDVTVTQQTDAGTTTATWRGALLWTIVSQARPIDGAAKNSYVQHSILVTGADGYAAAVSEGELDPKLEGKQVILAYMKDGTEFAGLRLVVPGDAHAARSVRDVAIVEVR